MARVLFTASADADAAAIFSYLRREAGKGTVIKYRALFRRLYEQLADFPDSGAPREALGPSIRIRVVAPYIVIYRYSEADNTVIVHRIVHGSREVTDEILRRP
jgi:toxin ParE1/3/4